MNIGCESNEKSKLFNDYQTAVDHSAFVYGIDKSLPNFQVERERMDPYNQRPDANAYTMKFPPFRKGGLLGRFILKLSVTGFNNLATATDTTSWFGLSAVKEARLVQNGRLLQKITPLAHYYQISETLANDEYNNLLTAAAPTITGTSLTMYLMFPFSNSEDLNHLLDTQHLQPFNLEVDFRPTAQLTNDANKATAAWDSVLICEYFRLSEDAYSAYHAMQYTSFPKSLSFKNIQEEAPQTIAPGALNDYRHDQELFCDRLVTRTYVGILNKTATNGVTDFADYEPIVSLKISSENRVLFEMKDDELLVERLFTHTFRHGEIAPVSAVNNVNVMAINWGVLSHKNGCMGALSFGNLAGCHLELTFDSSAAETYEIQVHHEHKNMWEVEKNGSVYIGPNQ